MKKISFKSLDHIQLCIPAGKEDEARKFYTGIIGLNEIQKPYKLVSNGGLWYEIAGIQLHIGIEDGINKSKRHPAFEIKNIDEVKKYLVGKGVTIKEEVQIPGQKRFSFYDPFGNRIELLEKTE